MAKTSLPMEVSDKNNAQSAADFVGSNSNNLRDLAEGSKLTLIKIGEKTNTKGELIPVFVFDYNGVEYVERVDVFTKYFARKCFSTKRTYIPEGTFDVFVRNKFAQISSKYANKDDKNAFDVAKEIADSLQSNKLVVSQQHPISVPNKKGELYGTSFVCLSFDK